MIRICNSFAQHSEATLLPAIGYVEKAVQRYDIFLIYSAFGIVYFSFLHKFSAVLTLSFMS